MGDDEGSSNSALIEHWDGTTWTVVANPGTSGLYGVSAASATDMWAVGGTLAEHWDGMGWTVVPIAPAPLPSYGLSDVSMSPTGTAWAVGFQDAAGGGLPVLTLTEKWNGSAWRYVHSVDPDPSYDWLNGVVMAPGGGVWAVGQTTGSPHPLIEYRSC